MKTTIVLLCALLLMGCAHAPPTGEDCAALKKDEATKYTPCVPGSCIGWSECILAPIVLAIP
jgi:hypothetical protein